MSSPSIEILTDRCVGCGLCVKACPFGALSIQERKAVIDYSACTLCGSCVSICRRYEAIADRRGDEVTVAGPPAGDVWVFCEREGDGLLPVSRELLAEARRLAGKRGTNVAAVLIGADLANCVSEAYRYGADSVHLAEHPSLAIYRDEPYATILTHAIRQGQPEILLGGATAVGRALLPRVAVMVHTGLTADCTSLDIDARTGLLLQTRPAFGGNILATILCRERRPQMATVRQGVLPRPSPRTEQDAPEPARIEFQEEDLASAIECLRHQGAATGGNDLHEAEIIVTAGSGTGGPEGVALVRQLAEALGAALGASRAVVDAGWLPYELQIGQTGTTVQPRLYIACGVSGAIQHRVGMQNSETIVAINRDPDAPLFEYADYAMVGHLQDLIPELIQRLRGTNRTLRTTRNP